MFILGHRKAGSVKHCSQAQVHMCANSGIRKVFNAAEVQLARRHVVFSQETKAQPFQVAQHGLQGPLPS